MSTIKSFKDLEVWKKGIVLTTDAYLLTTGFPKEEVYGLSSQLRRSCLSVPLNIAEGHGRKSTKSFINFLNIAYSSSNEIETCFIVAQNLKYINENTFTLFTEKVNEIQKMLNGLISALDKRLDK